MKDKAIKKIITEAVLKFLNEDGFKDENKTKKIARLFKRIDGNSFGVNKKEN